MPEAGEHIERNAIRIEVLEATDTQVVRARIRRVGQIETVPAPRMGVEPAASQEGAGKRDVVRE